MSRSVLIGLLAALLVAGCGRQSAPARGDSARDAGPITPTSIAPSAADAAFEEPDDAFEEPDARLPGHDFVAEAQLLYRIAACAGDQPVPERFDARDVDAHCEWLAPHQDKYRSRYVETAARFLATILPDGIPDRVVYPFGGGDLVSALVAFPAAREITTLSLELAGDPRTIDQLPPRKLDSALRQLRSRLGGMLLVSNNISKNLSESQQSLLPAQLAMFLIGLAVNGCEPVSLRFFRVEPDGSLHYYDDRDLTELAGDPAQPLKGDWADPSFSAAFANSELRFRCRGRDPDRVRVHRHIAANLGDRALDADPRVLRYLEAQGRVTAMTKAASYLLWRDDFSRMRAYLLDHLEIMLSDSTGIPPSYVDRDRFEFTTYGRFYGSLLDASERHNRDFRALWESQPYRKIGFRFGYVDNKSRAHLLITRRR